MIVSGGRSFTNVGFPALIGDPARLRRTLCGSFNSFAFHNPHPTWCLNAAIPPSMPLYSKLGQPHFIFSSTAGHPRWNSVRSLRKIGRANGCADSMYASTSADRFPMRAYYAPRVMS
jgi:hypothetical protein